MLNSKERLFEIFKKSGLSLSKFSFLLGRDRRTIANWLESDHKKELDDGIKSKVCEHFRYPKEIWKSDNTHFYSILNNLNNEEIKIIDEGYEGGLKYIFENENEDSIILHATFPNPAYRDFIMPFVYQNIDSEEVKIARKRRGEKIRDYSFVVSEWYSIKALLEFCFSPIGNFYSKEQKIAILELMIHTFKDNFNKTLYFFDSYDKKIYGFEMFYLSINIKENLMFFKAPLDMLIVEIRNTSLIRRIHHYYTNAQKCPAHINPKDSCFIMEILLACLMEDLDLIQSCKVISQKSEYGELFFKSISAHQI